jgi:hypothetical protein
LADLDRPRSLASPCSWESWPRRGSSIDTANRSGTATSLESVLRELGLVFERHPPENVRLAGLPVCQGATVEVRADLASPTRHVVCVQGDDAQLIAIENYRTRVSTRGWVDIPPWVVWSRGRIPTSSGIGWGGRIRTFDLLIQSQAARWCHRTRPPPRCGSYRGSRTFPIGGVALIQWRANASYADGQMVNRRELPVRRLQFSRAASPFRRMGT